MARVLGQATIKVNGRAVESNAGASIDLGGEERTTKMSAKKVVGYQAKIKQARIECAIPNTQDVSEKELHDIAGATVSFAGDNGKVYTVSNAHRTETLTTDDDSGDLRLVLEGDPAVVTGG